MKYILDSTDKIEEIARQFQPGDTVICGAYMLQNKLFDILFFERHLSVLDTMMVLRPSGAAAEKYRQRAIEKEESI